METKPESIAQFYERLQQRVSFCVALLSVSYVFGAGQYFFPGQIDWMELVHKAAAVIAALLVLPLMVRAAMMRRRNRTGCQEPEGFMAEAARKAGFGAWITTFVALVFLSAVSRNTLADMPAETMLQLVLAITLAAFAIGFFWLNRDVPEEDDFDLEDEA